MNYLFILWIRILFEKTFDFFSIVPFRILTSFLKISMFMSYCSTCSINSKHMGPNNKEFYSFQRVPSLDWYPVRGTHTRQEWIIMIFVDTSITLGADVHARESSRKWYYQIIEYNFEYFAVSSYFLPDSDCLVVCALAQAWNVLMWMNALMRI